MLLYALCFVIISVRSSLRKLEQPISDSGLSEHYNLRIHQPYKDTLKRGPLYAGVDLYERHHIEKYNNYARPLEVFEN